MAQLGYEALRFEVIVTLILEVFRTRKVGTTCAAPFPPDPHTASGSAVHSRRCWLRPRGQGTSLDVAARGGVVIAHPVLVQARQKIRVGFSRCAFAIRALPVRVGARP